MGSGFSCCGRVGSFQRLPGLTPQHDPAGTFSLPRVGGKVLNTRGSSLYEYMCMGLSVRRRPGDPASANTHAHVYL